MNGVAQRIPVLATVTATMRLRLLLLVAVLALLVPVSSALASGLDVIRDCTYDEVMSKTYTPKEYRDALKQIAADGDQYGNCRDVIKRAQQAALAAGHKPGNGGGSGGAHRGGAGAIGSAPAADQLNAASEPERQAVEQARGHRGRPVAVANTSVDPAKAGAVPGVSQVADLPAPLTVLLALLLIGALAIAGLRLRRLVDARRA
jgi:hypothetical protein